MFVVISWCWLLSFSLLLDRPDWRYQFGDVGVLERAYSWWRRSYFQYVSRLQRDSLISFLLLSSYLRSSVSQDSPVPYALSVRCSILPIGPGRSYRFWLSILVCYYWDIVEMVRVRVCRAMCFSLFVPTMSFAFDAIEKCFFVAVYWCDSIAIWCLRSFPRLVAMMLPDVMF